MSRHAHNRTRLAVALIALALPTSALAQGPSVETYGGPGEIQTELEGGAPSSNLTVAGGASDTPATTAAGSEDTASPNSQETTGTESPETAQAGPGTLAFTGMDFAILLGGGILLVAVGALMAWLLSKQASRRITADG